MKIQICSKKNYSVAASKQDTAIMGNFLEKDKEKKLKVVPFANK